VLVKLGEPQRAITLLERSTKVLPTDDAFATLASAYVAVGRLDDAANALRRALALNPKRIDVLTYLGVLLADRGQPDEAVGYLEIAGRDPSATAAILSILSLTEAQLGRAGEAVAAAGAASARAGDDANVYLRLGHAMLLAQRVEVAEQFLARAVHLDPSNLEAITRLGIARAAAGKPAEAERLFRRAIALQPGYEPAQQALAKLIGAKSALPP
jgi:Tfp pilus assembly protein PilF